jgi:hypothetical protein
MDSVHDAIVRGVKQSETAAMLPDSDSDSDSDMDSESESDTPCIQSFLGLKFSDQLARISASLHVFNSVMAQMLGKMLKTEIPVQISKQTVESSKRLLEHLLRQNELFTEVRIISNYRDRPHNND